MKLLLSAILILVSCPAFAASPAKVAPVDQADVTKGNNAFAVDLYSSLREKNRLPFFSRRLP